MHVFGLFATNFSNMLGLLPRLSTRLMLRRHNVLGCAVPVDSTTEGWSHRVHDNRTSLLKGLRTASLAPQFALSGIVDRLVDVVFTYVTADHYIFLLYCGERELYGVDGIALQMRKLGVSSSAP